jgi:MFS family permease
VTSARPASRWITAYRGRSLPPTVRRLGLASLAQDTASEMVYPLLPLYLASLGGSPALLGVMEAAAGGVLAVVKGAVGRWSDRLGRRRPFVAGGYALSAPTRPLLALTAATWQVLGVRILDRLAKGLRTAPRDAMIAEATPASEHAYAFSFHRGLDHLGAALGPLLAAALLWLAPGELRWVFAAATVPALVGPLVVWLGTRDRVVPLRPAEVRPPGAAPGGVGDATPDCDAAGAAAPGASAEVAGTARAGSVLAGSVVARAGAKGSVASTERSAASKDVTADAQGSAASTEAPAPSTERPAAVTEGPTAGAKGSVAAANAPVAAAEARTAGTEVPAASTEAPTASTERPAAGAKGPVASAKRPLVTAELPTTHRHPGESRGPREPPSEAPSADPRAPAAENPGRSPFPARLRLPLVAFALFALAAASDGFLLWRAGDLGLGAVGVTLLWSLLHCAKWAFSVPGGRLADRLGRRRAVGLGWLLFAAVYAALAAGASGWWLAALFLLYAAHHGLAEGATKALVLELGGASAGAGTQLGAFHFASGLGGCLASLWFGWAWQLAGPSVAFGASAGLALLAALLLAFGSHPRAAPGTLVSGPGTATPSPAHR